MNTVSFLLSFTFRCVRSSSFTFSGDKVGEKCTPHIGLGSSFSAIWTSLCWPLFLPLEPDHSRYVFQAHFTDFGLRRAHRLPSFWCSLFHLRPAWEKSYVLHASFLLLTCGSPRYLPFFTLSSAQFVNLIIDPRLSFYIHFIYSIYNHDFPSHRFIFLAGILCILHWSVLPERYTDLVYGMFQGQT